MDHYLLEKSRVTHQVRYLLRGECHSVVPEIGFTYEFLKHTTG